MVILFHSARRLLAMGLLGILVCAIARGDESEWQTLFPDEGPVKGWSVRQWNDVKLPADEGVVWKVEEGILRGSEPRGTWLMSDAQYSDFVLEFEWKLGDRGNSGCGIRFPAAGDPAFDGLELQMVDPRYYGEQQPPTSELTGSLYRAIAPAADVYRPQEWNKYVITCRGPRVTVELNGTQILDVDLDRQLAPTRRHDGSEAPPLKDRPRSGHIGFQELSRSGRVKIRGARLKQLD